MDASIGMSIIRKVIIRKTGSGNPINRIPQFFIDFSYICII